MSYTYAPCALSNTSVLKRLDGLRVALFASNETVRELVRKAVEMVEGSLILTDSISTGDIEEGTAPDIYVIDPILLESPKSAAGTVLDDRLARVVLFGSPAGLAATHPAVRRTVCAEMGPEVLATTLKNILRDNDLQESTPSLSPRERETLHFYGRGLTLKEIAHNLGISEKSAETYKTRGCRKLGISGRAAVLAFTEPSLTPTDLRPEG